MVCQCTRGSALRGTLSRYPLRSIDNVYIQLYIRSLRMYIMHLHTYVLSKVYRRQTPRRQDAMLCTPDTGKITEGTSLSLDPLREDICNL
jgi:hypothetical protein